MGLLDINGLTKLTEKLVKEDTVKVSSSYGSKAGEVIDNINNICEDLSNENIVTDIENTCNSFKVGTGKDIDVNSDVQNGVTSISIKGKTYQNLLSSLRGFGSIWVDNINNNTYDLELPKGLGQPMITFNIEPILKPNTEYTVIVNIASYRTGNLHICFMNPQNNTMASTTEPSFNTSGLKRIKLTTKSDIEASILRLLPRSQVENTFSVNKDIFIFEGDYTQTPIEELPEYFEGIQSVGENEENKIKIVSCGKNLFNLGEYSKQISSIDGVTILENGFIADALKGLVGNELRDKGRIRLKFKPNTSYHIRADITNEGTSFNLRFQVIYTDKTSSGALTAITTPTDKTIDYIYYGWNTQNNGGSSTFKNIIIAESSVKVEYEPYKEYIKTINQTLRSLPNGVCDEYKADGTFIQRVGKTVLDGSSSEKWLLQDRASDGYKRFRLDKFPSGEIAKVSSILISNLYPFATGDKWGAYARFDSVSSLNIYCLETDTTTLSQFITRLSTSNLEVYFELATPIITKLEPLKLPIYKDGHITIDTLIPPTSTHTVDLNKTTQIESTIREIGYLKVIVDNLEERYDTHFLETQHKLSSLNLNYSLEREEDY